MGWGGVYREVVSPERLVATELFDQDWTGGGTVNTLVLAEREQRTDLTLTILYTSKDARDGALASGMTIGMEAGYGLLDTLLVALDAGQGRAASSPNL